MRRVWWLTLLVGVPACGSVLGIEPLDVKNEPVADGGTHIIVEPDGDVVTTHDPPNTTDEDSGAPAATLPPAGTYTYDVTGGDEIKATFLDVPSNYGPHATVTIEHADGSPCFTQTITLRSGYVETMSDFCVDGTNLVMKTDVRDQSFSVENASTTSHCTPGDVYFSTDLTPRAWPHDCIGANTDSKEDAGSHFEVKGQYVYDPDPSQSTVTIAGESVPVLHFVDNRVVSGSQSGTNNTDWYLSPKNGLIVRLVRHVNITYDAGGIIGNVTYIENTDMTLAAPP